MSTHVFRQPPSVIQGIGEVYAAALTNAKVTTLAQMLRLSPEHVQRRVPAASMRQVKSWFAAAWLLRVEGVDPDIAEALVEAGINSVNDLADAGLQTLERAMSTAVERNKLQSAPSLYRLAEVQRSASRLRSTGSIHGTVTNFATGEPVAGAVLSSSNHRTETDADGYFELHGIASGKASVSIKSGLRGASPYPVFVKTDHLVGPIKVKIAASAARKREAVRESDGAFISPGRTTTVTLITRSIEEMPNDTYLRVREISESGAVRLLHLSRTRIGPEIQAERVEVKATSLPKGANVGHILHYQDGVLQLTDMTLRDIALQKLERTFGKVKLKTVNRIDPKFGI